MTEYQIGIDIRLSEKISQRIFLLKKKMNTFYPGNNETLPHVTLHTFKFYKKDYQKLINKIEKVNFKKIKIKLSSIKINTHKNKAFIYIDVLQNKDLINLHQKLVKACNPLRKKLIRFKDLERIKNGIYTKKEIAQINKFGYLRVMDFFKPHITLGLVDKKNATKVVNFFKNNLEEIKKQEFEIDKLLVGLFKFDYNKNIFLEKHVIQKGIKLK